MTRLDDVQAVVEWAEAKIANGHHARCKTRHGQPCDCYVRSDSYQAAYAVPGLLAIARAAHKVDEIYEGLRTDASDGTFSFWREDDLVAALHALRPAFRDFDAALADFEAGRDA